MHWLVIFALLLLFFGPSRLPHLGSSLGKALRGFKEGLNDKEKEANPNDPNARIEAAQEKSTERQAQPDSQKKS